MEIPGKVGAPGDPGFPGMKRKAGPRGEFRACDRLILSLREGCRGNIPSGFIVHYAKKAWMPETAESSSSREEASPPGGYLCLHWFPGLKVTAVLTLWILPLVSPFSISRHWVCTQITTYPLTQSRNEKPSFPSFNTNPLTPIHLIH